MVRIARQGNLRFVGPNGMGIWTSTVGLNLALDSMPISDALTFISQSGNLGGALSRVASRKGYGLSKCISVGNQADITASEYLEYFAQDDDTRVIALYMEGFKDGRRFIEVTRKVTPVKPVLILKGGTSRQGARAAMSHTASIAGTHNAFDAMCKQTRIGIEGAEIFGAIPKKHGKPVITLGWRSSGIVYEILKSAKIPMYENSEQCAMAMYALVKYSEIKRGTKLIS